MNDDTLIEVSDLNKSFGGKQVVSNVSLTVRKGEIFGFMGPNGSGKTTTIRMLCGLITPDSGQGTCLGYNIVTDSAAIKLLIGYVPQSFSLYQDLTVAENLLFIARVYSLPAPDQCVRRIISELRLTPYAHRQAGKLSGGWKQRLSLAAALIHNPKLLLLDEPTAGVDPMARRDFWNDITALAERGISSLVSTHYNDEAIRCSRLTYIMNGRIIITGTPNSILESTGMPGASLEDVFVYLMEKNRGETA